MFVSHAHEDHYDERIFLWEKIIKKTTSVFGWKIDRGDISHSLKPRKQNGSTIWTSTWSIPRKANPFDNAFLVIVDGDSIYHPGDYGPLGGISKISEINNQDMEYLRASAGRLDLMFMAGRLMDDKIPEYVSFSLRTAEPAVLFLMHQEAMEYNLKSLAEALSRASGNTKTIAPLDRGQVFFYTHREVRFAGHRP